MHRARVIFLVTAAFLAGITLAGSIALLVKRSSPGIEILLPTPTPAPVLKVYVTGAVKNPGVYNLRSGDRLEQVIEAAGGPNQDTDLSRVNLALRVQDQAHYHIPAKGEPVVPQSTITTQDSQRINLNTATAKELDSLPGIGPVLAQRIVDYREKNGPFRSVLELTRVEGIGPALVERIKELVTVQ